MSGGAVDLKPGGQRPAAVLMGVGRWVILVAVGFQLISNILEMAVTGQEMTVTVVLVHVIIAVACFVLLWRPWFGLCIGLIPLVPALLGYDIDADLVFLVLASATFAFQYRARAILAALPVAVGYGVLRSLNVAGDLDGLAELVVPCVYVVLFGSVLGAVVRAFLSLLERREVRLAILAEDIAEIRSGERLRLAGELRTVVGERLEEAWEGQKAPRHTCDAWALRDALERVQAICLDAVTRVRALVGMLREDPVAEGNDESLSIIGPVQILASMAETLRRQGFRVELRIDDRLNHRSVVTQLTVTRVAQLLLNSAEAMRPDPLRLKVECPSGETQVLAEIVTPNKLRKEDISAFERIRERVQALGGRFSRAFTGKGQLLEFRLPESRTGGVDGAAPAEEKKSLGRRIAGVALPLLVLGALVFWTCSTQLLEWPLAWAIFGYLSTAVMYWWPIPGGAMGAVAVVGMLLTPEQTPVALSAVILMACWKFTRGRNPYWTLGAGLVALTGLWVLSITRLTDSPELVVGVSMPFIGLVCAAISWQYAKIRNRQDQQAAALMEAIEAARTEERNLLARELHDVLAHHFSVVLLQCMAYGDSDDAEEVRFALDRIAGSLEAAEGELFLLTDVMSDGEKGDLPALVRPLTVADRLQGTLKNAHFQAEFKIDPSSDDLPQITRRTLTRAMQESVTNIIRYAEHGGKCLVELKMEETVVRLRVCNELPENKRESKLSLGYGLAGIQERINLSGGKFTAGPEDNQWVVTVELPNQGREAESLGGPSTYIH